MRARLVAPAVVALYWGALIAASLTKDEHWSLHALWAYSLAGAAAIAYVGSPGRWAIRSIVLGALLPPLVPIVVLLIPDRYSDPPDGTGMAWFIALSWVVASFAQVLATALLTPFLRWTAVRTGLIARAPAPTKE